MNDYAYRKEFGLSHKEFLKEPLDVYTANMQIMSVQAEIEGVKLRKLERQSKMNK